MPGVGEAASPRGRAPWLGMGPSGMARALLAMTVGLAPRTGIAQAAEPLPMGASVRFVALPAAGWRHRELLALDRTLLVVRRDGFGWRIRPDSIPLARVQRLDVRRATPDRVARTIVGGLVGGVVGTFVGGYVGYRMTADCGGCDTRGIGVLLGAPLGALVGIVGGAGLGDATAHVWEPVSLASASTR